MAIELLSDTTLRAIKASAIEHKGKQRLDDGGGLVLLLNVKGGGRAWRFNYTFAGKRKTISFGKYPDTTLALAREKAEAARESLAAKIDPSDVRKQERNKQQDTIEQAERVKAGLPIVNSFADVAQDWFKTHIAPLSEGHQTRTLAYLNHDLIPYLGNRPIVEIEAPELLSCLRRIESRTNNKGDKITETSNRVRTLMSHLWRHAIQTNRAKRDIAHDLLGALTKHESTNFSHITDPKILGQLLRDIGAHRGTPAVTAALHIMPYVFVRPAELRTAKWCNIDLDAKEWRYFVTKTKIDHIVPLADQVVKHLRELQKITGGGEYVFAVRNGNRPMSDNTINQALKGLGYTSDVIQPHGFRHTAATMLAELGWDESKIERQLSHLVEGVKGVYQKAKYLPERRTMMQAWADHLDALKAGAKVMPFKTA
ncbi:tyrosine-type recombinase/integrase [soil metagenome]